MSDLNETQQAKISKIKYKMRQLYPFNEQTKRELQEELHALHEGDYFTMAMIVKKLTAIFKNHNFKR